MTLRARVFGLNALFDIIVKSLEKSGFIYVQDTVKKAWQFVGWLLS